VKKPKRVEVTDDDGLVPELRQRIAALTEERSFDELNAMAEVLRLDGGQVIDFEAYHRLRVYYRDHPQAPHQPGWERLRRDWEGWRPGDRVRAKPTPHGGAFVPQ